MIRYVIHHYDFGKGGGFGEVGFSEVVVILCLINRLTAIKMCTLRISTRWIQTNRGKKKKKCYNRSWWLKFSTWSDSIWMLIILLLPLHLLLLFCLPPSHIIASFHPPTTATPTPPRSHFKTPREPRGCEESWSLCHTDKQKIYI